MLHSSKSLMAIMHFIFSEIIFYLNCDSLSKFENDGPMQFQVFRTGNNEGQMSTVRKLSLEWMRNPVRQDFQFVIQLTISHSSLNHNENMPYPV